MCAARLSLLILLLLATVAPRAADAPPEAEPLAHRLLAEAEAFTAVFDRELEEQGWRDELAEWEARLTESEHYIASGQYNNIQSEQLYEGLLRLIKAVGSRRADEAPRPAEIQALIDALGPPPAEGELPESEEISARRESYRAELTRLRERLSQLELAETRATRLQEQISALRRNALVDQLSQRYPQPWHGSVLAAGLRDLVEQARAVWRAPREWFYGLSEAERQRLVLWPFLAILLSAGIAGWGLRNWLLMRYGRDPELRNPSATRRVLAAVAEGVARGLIPALLFGGLLLWFNRPESRVEGLFTEAVNGLLIAAVFFVITAALTRAVLAPERPDWRLTAQSPEAANAVGYAMFGLLMVMAVELFYSRVTPSLVTSAELRSLTVAVLVSLKVLFLILILRRRWWRLETGSFALLLQRLLLAVLWAALIAALLGYSTLADYLLSRLLQTVSILLLLIAARAVLRELTAALLYSRMLRQSFGLRITTLQRFKFWFGVLLDPPLYLFALFWLVQVWGVPQQDLLRWGETAITGFSVGSITISLVDIAFALLVFVAAMAITRLTQRGLLNHVLPQMTNNEGLHHSLAALTGYFGLMLAVTLFVAALGINLESVALVAGALSVGIGFGLQNVVSNFVSGLILIVERPIKVGDWVLVGGNEGFVQRINFRATELETFQRASVIIPNAELISTAVVNMTYQDRYARIEVLIGVDYDSDPDAVRDILLQCATEHAAVLGHPSPNVLLQDFADSALLFELRCYISEATGKAAVASDLRFAILRALRAAGIGIPFPQRVVHFVGPAPGAGSDQD